MRRTSFPRSSLGRSRTSLAYLSVPGKTAFFLFWLLVGTTNMLSLSGPLFLFSNVLFSPLFPLSRYCEDKRSASAVYCPNELRHSHVHWDNCASSRIRKVDKCRTENEHLARQTCTHKLKEESPACPSSATGGRLSRNGRLLFLLCTWEAQERSEPEHATTA